MHARSLLLAAAPAGLVLGPALDQIHVRTGALAYEHPWWLDQAWWVGPQFAVAFVAIAAGALLLLRDDDPDAESPSTARLAWTTLAFVAAYLLTGLGHEREWIVVGILAAALVARLVLERVDRRAALVLLLLAVGGSAYEATLSANPETFDYAEASLATIPAWLPLLYLHAGIAVVALVRSTRR